MQELWFDFGVFAQRCRDLHRDGAGRLSSPQPELGVAIDIPTGIITFLFTDIEGSSRLWDGQPEAMKEAVRQHDAIVRQTIEGHGGYVFTTAGDSFAAAFADPVGALSASV